MSRLTARRLQDDLAYDAQCLQEVKIGYREYVCHGAMSSNSRVRFAVPLPDNRDPAPAFGPAIPRRMRITPQDLAEHGFTVGCPGCEAAQSRLDSKHTLRGMSETIGVRD